MFGSNNEERESISSKFYPPPTISGCSTLNFTHFSSLEETFSEIQKAYDLAKGKAHDKFARGYTAMQVPFEVVPDKKAGLGNALIAKESIKKGTTVWEAWHYGRFSARNRKKYYRFLEPLSLKQQCFVLSMTHASYDGEYLEVPMDEGNFIQQAQFKDQVNLDVNCVTLRDISAGERFYMNFSEYIGYDHNIEWFDDLKFEAFREGGLRGGSGTYSPPAATAWLEQVQDQNSSNRVMMSTRREHGYPNVFWPTLFVLVAIFAIKKATVSSKKEGFNKNKLC
jgi:hypothetical protein